MKSPLRPLMAGLIAVCAVVSSAIAQPADVNALNPSKSSYLTRPGRPTM